MKMNILSNWISLFFILIFSLSMSRCAIIRKVALDYSSTKLPASQIIRNVKYWSSAQADQNKNRLDLFLPKGKDWPTLVFVHGGEWSTGDRALKVLGADIYGNIGRYFASQGIGVAVISYRLMPKNDWRSQIMDVARAYTWVHQHIQKYHGNPKKIFLSGHSSGAQLATRVALDPAPLLALNSSSNTICGVIPVSGAGYDLTDEATYQSAKKEDVFLKLFQTDDISQKLRKQLSPQGFVTAKAPPFLILYASKEEKVLKEGSIALHERLRHVGIESQLVEVPHEGHKTIVLSLSQPQQITTATMAVFMKSLKCD